MRRKIKYSGRLRHTVKMVLATLGSILILFSSNQIVMASESTAPIELETSQSLPLPKPAEPAAALSPEAVSWNDPQFLTAAGWPTLEQVTAKVKSFIVIDRLTGATILAKDEQSPQYPASTTKILTALLALENLSLDQTVTASAAAVKLDWDATKAGFLAGETVTVRDALAGLMLPSGNDAANLLAEAISGDQALFAEKMTARAKELGAQHANFVNAHGLHNELHQVSAADLALITSAAMRYPIFRELVNTPTYAMAATNLHPANGWAIYTNSNTRLLLLDQANYRSTRLTKISGVKTGSTKAAGNCLVSSATTAAGQELVCVLFGVDPEDPEGNVVSYSRTLLEAAAEKVDTLPHAHQVVMTEGDAIDIPDSDFQAVPERSLLLLQGLSAWPELTWQWPDAAQLSTLADNQESLELQVLQDDQSLVAIPVLIEKVPGPLDELVNGETTGQSSTGTLSLWEWPLWKPLLATLFTAVVVILAYALGRATGRRQGLRAAKRRN